MGSLHGAEVRQETEAPGGRKVKKRVHHESRQRPTWPKLSGRTRETQEEGALVGTSTWGPQKKKKKQYSAAIRNDCSMRGPVVRKRKTHARKRRDIDAQPRGGPGREKGRRVG